MSVYRYQAEIIFPYYRSVITIEAGNDRDALTKLNEMAGGNTLVKASITRNGVNLQEYYRRKKAQNEKPARKKARRPPRNAKATENERP